MKKLSKLSLLGEMDLLSQAELKQLVGAKISVVDCSTATTAEACANLTSGDAYCNCGENLGHCAWAYSAMPNPFCTCVNMYGG